MCAWGDRPILLLLGIRLGLDGVNPVGYEMIKLVYTFPRSVGIAGGRPSSSYYFVDVQGDGLFYLDPHHACPAVSLHPFLPSTSTHTHTTSPSHDSMHNTVHVHDTCHSLSPEVHAHGESINPEYGYGRGGSMSPDNYVRTGSMSSNFAHAHGHKHMSMMEDELVRIPD
ncbi:hypothetical protein C8R44DRAFT_647235 [Mycena epipterygia]|nr:hypothetical protein C8R44DRAFT_647235 [Mycena epipterygia]